jgi:hypothetical protein
MSEKATGTPKTETDKRVHHGKGQGKHQAKHKKGRKHKHGRGHRMKHHA